VSLDAAEPEAFLAVRGKDMFARIVRNVRAFTALQRTEGCERPLVSLWLTGPQRDNRSAAGFCSSGAPDRRHRDPSPAPRFRGGRTGLARSQSALFEKLEGDEPKTARGGCRTGRRARRSTSTLRALPSPASSLKCGGDDQPWSLCRRPWTLIVLHRPWPSYPLLHRAFFDARL